MGPVLEVVDDYGAVVVRHSQGSCELVAVAASSLTQSNLANNSKPEARSTKLYMWGLTNIVAMKYDGCDTIDINICQTAASTAKLPQRNGLQHHTSAPHQLFQQD